MAITVRLLVLSRLLPLLAPAFGFGPGGGRLPPRSTTHGIALGGGGHVARPPSRSALRARKTDDEERFIWNALAKNSLFDDLAPPSLRELVDGFERKEAVRGYEIVTQGDSSEGANVYLVAEGGCEVTVNGEPVPEPYGTIGPDVLFGELGVLYSDERAATVSAGPVGVTYYEIAGDTFKRALNLNATTGDNLDLEIMQEVDILINQVLGTQALYGGDIIPPYKPERAWLWRQFTGTILEICLETTLLSMLASVAFVALARGVSGEPAFDPEFVTPDATLPFVRKLSLVREVWDIQTGLTTFILTFFVNQSFNFWNDVYNLARTVQGKIGAFNLVLATNAKREENGDLAPEAEEFLDEVGQYSRLFHVLLWAGLSKRFAVLATPDGLRRMEGRGLMNGEQLEVIQGLDLPQNKLFMAPMEWMVIRSNRAIDEGILRDDPATKSTLLREYAQLRGALYTIYDKMDGRMPLPYAHFVQILVDTFVLAAPLALYPTLGEFSVVAVGLITLFYTGLNNMAKIFLDPLNNENFCKNAIFMDLGVLIRESNAVSTQWKRSGAKLPF